ncbi:MAG: ornithine cyclodeaminase family protein [Acidobacteriota bacterium]
MSCRYLSAADVRQVLTIGAAIEAIEAVMKDAASNAACAPPRTLQVIHRGEDAADCLFLAMPSTWACRHGAAAKIITYVPDNLEGGRPGVQGLAVLFDTASGSPRLIADAAALTTIRTGAMVGLATRYLAPTDARVVGIIGTGALAFDLIAGVAAVRDIERVVVTNRTLQRAEEFVDALPWRAELVRSADSVAAEVEILITATSSLQPVISRQFIQPGTHINAVGNFSPGGRELDGPTVAACDCYVDDLEGALVEAGELILAAEEGLIPSGKDSVVGDLPALVSGRLPGRTSSEQLTLFKSVGTALADIAALTVVADIAEAQERGILLEP